MAYGGNPTTDTSDALRVLVQDTSSSTASELLSDTEYDYFSSVTSNIWIAAQLAANTLAARAASSDSAGVKSKAVGALKIEYSAGLQDAETYRSLSKKFGRMAAAQIAPFSGGQSISGKVAEEQDTDRVQPAFARGLMDNRNAIDFATRLTDETT